MRRWFDLGTPGRISINRFHASRKSGVVSVDKPISSTAAGTAFVPFFFASPGRA